MKAGGKSRKTGGVSKKLISRLKSEYSTNSSKSCGKKSTTEDGKKHTVLFETSPKSGD